MPTDVLDPIPGPDELIDRHAAILGEGSGKPQSAPNALHNRARRVTLVELYETRSPRPGHAIVMHGHLLNNLDIDGRGLTVQSDIDRQGHGFPGAIFGNVE